MFLKALSPSSSLSGNTCCRADTLPLMVSLTTPLVCRSPSLLSPTCSTEGLCFGLKSIAAIAAVMLAGDVRWLAVLLVHDRVCGAAVPAAEMGQSADADRGARMHRSNGSSLRAAGDLKLSQPALPSSMVPRFPSPLSMALLNPLRAGARHVRSCELRPLRHLRLRAVLLCAAVRAGFHDAIRPAAGTAQGVPAPGHTGLVDRHGPRCPGRHGCVLGAAALLLRRCGREIPVSAQNGDGGAETGRCAHRDTGVIRQHPATELL